MINPDLLHPKMIVFIHDQVQWEDFQSIMCEHGSMHRESTFSSRLPYRWVKDLGSRWEWYKGDEGSARDSLYRDYEIVDYADLCAPTFFDDEAFLQMF